MVKKSYFILDANFFISIKHVKVRSSLERMREIRDELGIKLYISDMVFKELPFYQTGARKSEFEDTIEIRKVENQEIEHIKKSLEGAGVAMQRHAQDPDLTLIALAIKMISPKNRIYVVSDDFKLGENIKSLNTSIEFLSLSAFLLLLSKKSSQENLKKYFKYVQNKVLKYNLDYVLKRRDIYNPTAKLLHLIESAVSVADDGEIDITEIGQSKKKTSGKSKSRFKSTSIDDLDEEDESARKLTKICNKYIKTKNVPFDDLNDIVLMIPLLDDIIKGRRFIVSAKESLKEDRTEKAINSLRSAINTYLLNMQIAGSLLPKNQFEVFQKITCKELSQCEFLRSFLYIGLEKIDLAVDSLNATAFYSTQAENTKSVLAINYLKALIFIFNQKYTDAIEQYQFTSKLATNYSNNLLLMKCSIGHAITLFLSGMDTESLDLIDSISEELHEEENLENAVIVFQELGDYFYAISNPKIAIALYNEALQCAVDSKNIQWKIGFILDKMKRSYMASMLDRTDSAANVDTILDRVHECKDIDKYNEAISQLSKFNSMLYTDLEDYTKKGKKTGYYDIDENLREKFDVVDILESGDMTVLIAFNKAIGLLGFRVKLKNPLAGIPENYTIKITKRAKITILKPSDQLRAKYLLRGIVSGTMKDIDIDRNIPIFFSQMKI
ncbi:MAG: hypothetical protein GY870_08805 [archaeon]|nr:hypothetical protein [archaeon]